MESTTLRRDVPASYIKDWLKRYLQHFDKNIDKFRFPIAPQDQALADDLRLCWVEEHHPVPGPEVLGNPRNRGYLWQPQTPDLETITMVVSVNVVLREDPYRSIEPSLGEAVRFRILPLDDDATRLDIEWDYLSVAPFVKELLAAFCQDYPEPKPATTEGVEEVKGPEKTLKGRAEPSAGPWDVIQNQEQKDMVRLWHDGLTKPQIAERKGFAKGSVENMFSMLRRRHGIAVVPFKKDLRKSRARARK